MIFMCGDYFRYKDVELVADSHFGHIVPIAFLRSWKVFATASFTVASRIGIENIDELSKKKLGSEELQKLRHESFRERKEEKIDLLSVSTDSEDQDDPKMKNPFSTIKSKLQLFEKKLSLEEKGTFKVWKTHFKLFKNRQCNVFLHAVNDSKVVFRVSNRYAGLPREIMNVTDQDSATGKRISKQVRTSAAHKCFRKRMGFNDQSDAKRTLIGLSSRYYKHWPKHLVAKSLEDCIIDGYLNYLLDPNCPIESWTKFLLWFVQELLDSGEEMRKNKLYVDSYKRTRTRGLKRPRPGSDAALLRGEKCKGGWNIASIKKLPPNKRTRRCSFCNRQKALYKCRSCQAHLCLDRPQSNRGARSFPANGPYCYQRFHGIHRFPY